jgi:hypothetical protein
MFLFFCVLIGLTFIFVSVKKAEAIFQFAEKVFHKVEDNFYLLFFEDIFCIIVYVFIFMKYFLPHLKNYI